MSSNTTLQTVKGSVGLINPTVMNFFLTFNLLICAELIGCFGIVGNAINILNFTRQGLRDSVNVTLTALAVSDIGSLLFQLLLNVLLSPFWDGVELPFTSFTTLAVMLLYPHGYFIRVGGYITAFAAFERCLCVVLPLKVKTIVTRKVSAAVNCGIYAVLLLYLFPQYYVIYIDLKYSTKTNRSSLTMVYRQNAEPVLRVAYLVNDLVVPYVSFITLIFCTAFIVASLKSKSKWRLTVTATSAAKKDNSQLTSKGEIIPTKERKTIVMLTAVSVIFVVCLTPSCAMMAAVGVVRELKLDGAYFDITLIVYSFTSLLETINCSVNILVYYKMSTRYRETFHELFPSL